MNDQPRTHRDCEQIAQLLERATCLSENKIGKGKNAITCTTYSTPSGIVEFRDYANRHGWTMLTECPSAGVCDNVVELTAMLDKTAYRR